MILDVLLVFLVGLLIWVGSLKSPRMRQYERYAASFQAQQRQRAAYQAMGGQGDPPDLVPLEPVSADPATVKREILLFVVGIVILVGLAWWVWNLPPGAYELRPEMPQSEAPQQIPSPYEATDRQ